MKNVLKHGFSVFRFIRSQACLREGGHIPIPTLTRNKIYIYIYIYIYGGWGVRPLNLPCVWVRFSNELSVPNVRVLRLEYVCAYPIRLVTQFP